MKFAAYGTVLASPIPFPELLRASARAEWTLLVAPPSPLPREGGWVRTWCVGGNPWLSVKPAKAGWRLRFHRAAVFEVDSEAKTIAWTAAPGAGPALLRHLLLDQVLPRALHTPGTPVLHASAVVLPAGAAAFTGRTGLGKSTLAAAFARAGRRLLTDDALRLIPRDGRFLAFPAYPGLRLGGASIGILGKGGARVTEGHWKQRVVPPWATRPAPLRAIYVLDRGRRISIESLGGSSAVVDLFKAGMRLGDGRENAAAEFEGAVRLARGVPVRRLSIPRDLELLTEVVAAVERDMREIAAVSRT